MQHRVAGYKDYAAVVNDPSGARDFLPYRRVGMKQSDEKVRVKKLNR